MAVIDGPHAGVELLDAQERAPVLSRKRVRVKPVALGVDLVEESRRGGPPGVGGLDAVLGRCMGVAAEAAHGGRRAPGGAQALGMYLPRARWAANKLAFFPALVALQAESVHEALGGLPPDRVARLAALALPPHAAAAPRVEDPRELLRLRRSSTGRRENLALLFLIRLRNLRHAFDDVPLGLVARPPLKMHLELRILHGRLADTLPEMHGDDLALVSRLVEWVLAVAVGVDEILFCVFLSSLEERHWLHVMHLDTDPPKSNNLPLVRGVHVPS
mmetsp:Transcript_44150/g.100540  ORF Transcript_44150/g.100540 Transcript_44150/m.100540 type:complete len:274 (-) Transcript_44150:104-925(-)